MTILALEFSSPQRSVAVWRAGSVTEIVEAGGRATNAFGMIEKVLAQAGIEREQVEVLAVGLGPGSYTGIRVALAVAQGWQLAGGVRLLGVSSAECLAAQAQAEKILGRVSVVIDAQRNEFYLTTYEISATARKEISPLRIVAQAEVRARLEAGEILMGPEVRRWFSNATVLFPRAARLARLAVGRNDFTPGEKLEPIYLREVRFVKAPPPRTVT